MQDACDAISNDWALHGSAMRAASAVVQGRAAATQPTVAAIAVPAVPSTGKLFVVSVPDGADIEVDGSFVGNTPSEVQVSEGDHSVSVKKAGFKHWERKLKVTAGSSVRLNADLEKAENP